MDEWFMDDGWIMKTMTKFNPAENSSILGPISTKFVSFHLFRGGKTSSVAKIFPEKPRQATNLLSKNIKLGL